MKTKEVIRQLQKLDPSGEIEVVVGGADIHFIEKLPGYYDGAYQVLITDEQGYVIGAKIKRYGDKIVIREGSIADFILDQPDFPVETIDEYEEKRITELRKESIEFYETYIKDYPDTPQIDYYKSLIQKGKDYLEHK